MVDSPSEERKKTKERKLIFFFIHLYFLLFKIQMSLSIFLTHLSHLTSTTRNKGIQPTQSLPFPHKYKPTPPVLTPTLNKENIWDSPVFKIKLKR
ncbi:hypothetical protein BCY86_03730 [Pajaroellobacter abortibovis]|uniref:Uncharacterized protein n=1 Tax=Pajaroellobacter abortibovis TaxID=1882918 RepID=A0A1L6MWS3_9BACT|nr:hypothetical protein BCY86_03730 [Pajaroellobacter abortibovis]